MATKSKQAAEIIAVGFKDGGRTGFATAEQIGSLRECLRRCEIADEDSDKIIVLVKDSGLLNASATLQWLKSIGAVKTEVDVVLEAMFK